MRFKPQYEGEVPTLGWLAIEWMQDFLSTPEKLTFSPFVPTQEQAQFLLNVYAINPTKNEAEINRAILSRPRGWGKSPFLAAMCLFEALGPAVFDGYDAQGRPVGMPWVEKSRPIVHLAGTAIDQTQNTWQPLLDMAKNDDLQDEFNLDINEKSSFIGLPDLMNGEISAITSAARTIKGRREVFAVLDQTEEWIQSNGGLRLAATLKGNIEKTNGRLIESPNAFVPGEGSVAENSWKAFELIKTGKARRESGILYDHREAPSTTDIFNEKSLRAGIEFAYGDSADSAGGWVNVDRQVRAFFDTSSDTEQLRRDKLNQITSASNAWFTKQQVELMTRTDRVVSPREPIVLGFDGSRGVTHTAQGADGQVKRRGGKKADASVLMAMCLSDGYSFPVGFWEAPDGPAGDDWRAPEAEMLKTIDNAHRDYRVVGFYADPNSGWQGHAANWNAKWGSTYKVKSSGYSAVAWDTNRVGQVIDAFEDLKDAVLMRDITVSNNPDLYRHLLNARKVRKREGYILGKPDNDFTAKVDAVYSLMLCNQARLDALNKGANQQNDEYLQMPIRISR